MKVYFIEPKKIDKVDVDLKKIADEASVVRHHAITQQLEPEVPKTKCYVQGMQIEDLDPRCGLREYERAIMPINPFMERGIEKLKKRSMMITLNRNASHDSTW